MKHRSKRRSRSRDRRRSSSSSSLYSDEPQQETNAAYQLYMKLKRERERAEGNPVKCRSLDLETDFPNYKRKLVVQHIPGDQTAPQILDYFYGILAQVSSEAYTKNPILSVEKDRYKDLGFVTLEFRKREDADICLNLDGTKYSSQQQTPVKIQRCKRFVIFWNDEISRGRNPAAEALGIRVKEHNFQDTGTGGDAFYEDRRIFMGGIPPQMQEDEVRQMCESFGKLKNFNLIKDSGQLNKGYAFFEYQDERAIDKAIRHLNQLEIKDKRLKVQRASEGVQKSTVLCMHAAVPPEKQLPVPTHCSTPSRVI